MAMESHETNLKEMINDLYEKPGGPTVYERIGFAAALVFEGMLIDKGVEVLARQVVHDGDLFWAEFRIKTQIADLDGWVSLCNATLELLYEDPLAEEPILRPEVKNQVTDMTGRRMLAALKTRLELAEILFTANTVEEATQLLDGLAASGKVQGVRYVKFDRPDKEK